MRVKAYRNSRKCMNMYVLVSFSKRGYSLYKAARGGDGDSNNLSPKMLSHTVYVRFLLFSP